MSKPVANVHVRKQALSMFIVNPLIHIHQKKKIAAKIAGIKSLLPGEHRENQMRSVINAHQQLLPRNIIHNLSHYQPRTQALRSDAR
jgi:hypothetical protein